MTPVVLALLSTALGRNFSNRGRRLDEQILLLRRLWTEQTVTLCLPRVSALHRVVDNLVEMAG
jgi:alkanesulfonate monooxygenase SsuD/methylene tetrahydromethanopterin reductase-like flavin-dependent oxidoreductase (luciferase family)